MHAPPFLKAHIDKSNFHRLLELTVQQDSITFTRPLCILDAFWSNAPCTEISILTIYQPNCSYLCSSTYPAREWLTHTAHSFNLLEIREVEERCTLLGILRLFGGDVAEGVDWRLPRIAGSRDHIESSLLEMLVGYVSSQHFNCNGWRENDWDSITFWLVYSALSNNWRNWREKKLTDTTYGSGKTFDKH